MNTTTRIKLHGPTPDHSLRMMELTPTWSDVMPALLAVLTSGTPEGQRMVAGELTRLATEVDKANANAKAEPSDVELAQRTVDSFRRGMGARLYHMADANERDAMRAQTESRRAFCLARAGVFYHAAGEVVGDADPTVKIARTEKSADTYRAALDALTTAETNERKGTTAAAKMDSDELTQALAGCTWGNLTAFAVAVLAHGQEPREAFDDNLAPQNAPTGGPLKGGPATT